MSLLVKLVEQDFGYKSSGKWGRSEVHSSLVVDEEREVFWYNDKGICGGVIEYVTKVRGMKYSEAKEYVLQNKDYSTTYVQHLDNGKEVVTYPLLADSFYEAAKQIKKWREYFYKRGINDSFIDRFKLGYWNGFATVPFYQNSTFRNIQLRKEEPKKILKLYKDVGASIFNSDILNVTEEVFITEGPLDAIAMIQNDGVACVSTDIGGNLLPEWLHLFRNQKRIYVVMDNDGAGEQDAIRMSNFLGSTRCKIYTFTGFSSGYDPVDYYRDGNKNLVEKVRFESVYSFQRSKK